MRSLLLENSKTLLRSIGESRKATFLHTYEEEEKGPTSIVKKKTTETHGLSNLLFCEPEIELEIPLISKSSKDNLEFNRLDFEQQINTPKHTVSLNLNLGKLLSKYFNPHQIKGIFIPIVSVGASRSGKSTFWNIIMKSIVHDTYLDPSKSFFKSQRGINPVTDGIHGCVIRYSEMNDQARKRLDKIFGAENCQEKHIILLDCEGTDVGNQEECNKIYTAALAISQKGVLTISTLKRVYQPLIQCFFDNYETHVDLLEKNQSNQLHVNVVVKDQDESDLSNEFEKQEVKRKDHFRFLQRADEFLKIAKPMVYLLTEAEKTHREAFDKGDFGFKAPYTEDVVECFWQQITHNKDVFLNSNINTLNDFKEHLVRVTEIVNGRFKASKGRIIRIIEKYNQAFREEAVSLLLNVKPEKELIYSTYALINLSLIKFKRELKEELANMGESNRNINLIVNIFSTDCRRILDEMFEEPQLLKFIQYEYLAKMLEQQSLWKIDTEVLQALSSMPKTITDEDLQILGQKYPVIAAYEEVDAETRKDIKSKLEPLALKYPELPMKNLTDKLEGKRANAMFDVLKFLVKKHILYLFCIVKGEYSKKQTENWFGFSLTALGLATAGSGVLIEVILQKALVWAVGGMLTGISGWIAGNLVGRDIELDLQIEQKIMEELKHVFKDEIERKDNLILLADDSRFLRHIEGLSKKTIKVYLPNLIMATVPKNKYDKQKNLELISQYGV